MARHEISISCPFCHGNKKVKVDISNIVDELIQKELVKVYKSGLKEAKEDE